MSESSTEPVIPDPRSYAAVFSNLEGGPSGEQRRAEAVWRRIRLRRTVDHVALRNIRRSNLATTSIRVGASYTSLDIWYVDLDVSADILNCFRQWLSRDELAKAKRFRRRSVSARICTKPATLLDEPPSDVWLPIGLVAPQPLSGSRMEETASRRLRAVADTLSSTSRTAEATRSSHSPVVRPSEWTSSFSDRFPTSNHSHVWCSRMPSVASSNSLPIPCQRF